MKSLIGLYTAILLLALLNIAISTWTIDLSPIDDMAALPISAPLPPALRERNVEMGILAIERPLFSPGRRDFVLQAAQQPKTQDIEANAPSPPAPAPLDATLLGTRLIGSEISVLIEIEGQEPKWLDRGQQVNGWLIDDVSTDRVTVSADGQQRILEFPEGTANAGQP
jgi:hypothetical protein